MAPLRAGRGGQGEPGPGGEGEEFHFGDFEGEAAVALAADVGGRVAADGDQPL